MKKLGVYLILIFLTLFFAGCKYSFIVPEEVPEIDTTKPTSFATQIIPIFTSGDKCTACHNGSQAPNLLAASAYSQLMTKYVDTVKPENSLIYTFPNPTSSGHGWKKYSATEAALILQWIKEGAKNN